MQGILFLIYIIGGSIIGYEVFWAFWSLVKDIFTFKKKKVPFWTLFLTYYKSGSFFFIFRKSS